MAGRDVVTSPIVDAEPWRQPQHRVDELVDALQAVTSPMLVADVDGSIRWVNPALCQSTGYRDDELRGRPLSLLQPSGMHPAYAALQAAMRAGSAWRGRLPVRRRDGSHYLDDRRSTPLHDDRGALTGHVWVGDDVTERSRAEERLRHSEEALRRLVDCAPDAIVVTDGQGRIERANPRVLELLGYAPDELEGMALGQLMPSAVADRHPGYMQEHASGRRGMTAAGREVLARRKDGSLVCVHVRVGEMPTLGGRRFVGFLRDMSDSKRAQQEHERLLRQLMQAQKMEALGQLTGGIAHDFNNMLTGILGLSTLALERHVDDPEGKVATYLREIARVSERGRDLVERLMRFARPAATQQPVQPRALRPVVEEVLRMLESALPPTLAVTLRAEPGLPEARFVEVDLHQVLTNLVINARDALDGRGEVLIELAGLDLAGTECASCGQPVRGRHLALRVHDNGSGIPPALLSRIFDPFFTTKDVGKGTGLGLAMVHSLVHHNGGHVRVLAREGQGTVFEVLLPAAPA